MQTLFEWIGTLALLGILLLVVPIFFMGIITLQFRLGGETRVSHPDTVDTLYPRAHGGERDLP